MAQQLPPSYQDAIRRLDWLELVAPYVAVTDIPGLCSVNSHFCNVFVPRLWNDPLRTVRSLGLEPSHDLDWYFHFVFVRAPRTRPSTLRLVTILDFRDFAKANTQFSSDDNPKTIPETFRRLPKVFPGLRCILLDGHTEADPASLATPVPVSDPSQAGAAHRPLMLSIADCDAHLSMPFFSSDFLRDIVYLDVSCLPGSLQGLLAAAQVPGGLAHLRVLKIRGRELDDGLASSLFKALRGRLWSLDLSENKLSDAVVASLSTMHAGATALRSDSHFEVEGRLVRSSDPGDALYGPFEFIRESSSSGTFDHPERYFADAPAYSNDGTYGPDSVRSDGIAPLKRDAAADVKSVLAGGLDHPAPDTSQLPLLDVCSAPNGLTHLDLTGNRLTSSSVAKLLRTMPGQLESFACDAPLLQPHGVSWSSEWPKGTKMFGILGSAHTFRPVFSSNLRVLRIHHSAVTQVPTLETAGMSTMARLWFSETTIRESSETAYPQALEPDMNPRLTSLTLTKIPRRSVGPLTSKLTHFLKLAALQEQAIRDTNPSASRRRSPAIVRGLRHIRLEFEADPVEDPVGWSNENDLDANRLMDMGVEEGFSFFQDENVLPKPKLPPRPAAAPQMTSASETAAFVSSTAGAGTNLSARLRHAPYSSTTSEYISHTLDWGGRPFEAQVWIGTGTPGPFAAVNAYMAALRDPALRAGSVGPATPAHVKAGAPAGSLLFYSAWDSMVLPKSVRTPSKTEVHGMQDVIEGLKAFRRDTRAMYETARDRAAAGEVVTGPHLFWTGKLEVVTQQSMAHYQSSRYWR